MNPVPGGASIIFLSDGLYMDDDHIMPPVEHPT